MTWTEEHCGVADLLTRFDTARSAAERDAVVDELASVFLGFIGLSTAPGALRSTREGREALAEMARALRERRMKDLGSTFHVPRDSGAASGGASIVANVPVLPSPHFWRPLRAYSCRRHR